MTNAQRIEKLEGALQELELRVNKLEQIALQQPTGMTAHQRKHIKRLAAARARAHNPYNNPALRKKAKKKP